MFFPTNGLRVTLTKLENLISGRVPIRARGLENFLKKSKRGGRLLGTREYFLPVKQNKRKKSKQPLKVFFKKMVFLKAAK